MIDPTPTVPDWPLPTLLPAGVDAFAGAFGWMLVVVLAAGLAATVDLLYEVRRNDERTEERGAREPHADEHARRGNGGLPPEARRRWGAADRSGRYDAGVPRRAARDPAHTDVR